METEKIIISEKSISHLLELVMDMQHDLTRAETKLEMIERYASKNEYSLKADVIKDIIGSDRLTQQEMDEINEKLAEVPY